MTAFENPALAAFVAQLGEKLVFAQVLIRRAGTGFTLRHIGDTDVSGETLRAVTIEALHAFAQTTEAGAFRPLKSAPNLPRGWHTHAANSVELGTALDRLYPGAVADWFASRMAQPPVTNYREFTSRQTGMYRVTTFPDDRRAEQITRACCDPRFCLKCRLWIVPGLAPDTQNNKSLIPCLEPCALLLEFARKVVRLEQQGNLPDSISSEDTRGMQEKLDQPTSSGREADFESPENPRRIALLLQLPGRD
ncbi:MAG: hypothetical protein EXS29_05280 [Pedosphaera sp.]|nr:hypothetical protein [Pedosphaera sp.]MST00705.1 hypothetical protein [Pedosphaera sp.]